MHREVSDSEFAYIFEDKSSRYVLVQSEYGSSDLSTCVVYDLNEKMALIIEDDEIAYEVLKRLQDLGARMLQGLPR